MSEQRIGTSRREQGQALVETALFLLALILILLGLLDLGRAYYTYLAMQNAAAEGATYGMFHPTWETPADNVDPDNINYRTRTESESGLVDWSAITVTTETVFPSPGNRITVTIDYDFELITPIGHLLARDKTISLHAKAVQTILRDDVASP